MREDLEKRDGHWRLAQPPAHGDDGGVKAKKREILATQLATGGHLSMHLMRDTLH
ncbi:MAG: hypothetical protein JRL30_26305 [Deltaproteobacteria bacterium]|nr:hypothetical protein [Deltaproteobacteria bacterium]